MSFTHDALLIGHGIAGAVLASTMQRRGLRVHVYDHELPGSASKAAAGVVNPVVFRRDVLSWRADELLPIARSFYTSLESDLRTRFWHPLPLVKVFPTPNEVLQWEQAMAKEPTRDLISREPQASLERCSALNIPYGHGTVRSSAWLDVPAFLRAHRNALLDKGTLTDRSVIEEDIEMDEHGVRIGGHSAPWCISAIGPFDTRTAGLVPVQGEVLKVRIPGIRLDRMVHRGVFLLPMGDDLYRVGATFRWNDVWDGPTEEARNWLLSKLKELINVQVEVLDQQAGVRPASRDRRPLLGVVGPSRAVLNGLGSRGVMLAPWCAQHLVDHLFHHAPLDPEVDILRWDRSSDP